MNETCDLALDECVRAMLANSGEYVRPCEQHVAVLRNKWGTGENGFVREDGRLREERLSDHMGMLSSETAPPPPRRKQADEMDDLTTRAVELAFKGKAIQKKKPKHRFLRDTRRAKPKAPAKGSRNAQVLEEISALVEEGGPVIIDEQQYTYDDARLEIDRNKRKVEALDQFVANFGDVAEEEHTVPSAMAETVKLNLIAQIRELKERRIIDRDSMDSMVAIVEAPKKAPAFDLRLIVLSGGPSGVCQFCTTTGA
jgi:hypothetical protein